MEQPAYYLCLFFLALLLPLLLLKLLITRRGGAVRLPPGLWRLPVIGSLHHLTSRPLVHRVLADLARRLDAPLMYLKLGEVPVVVVTSPEAAREIMQTHDVVFATRPWSPTIKIMNADGEGLIFARYGALWRQLRKICILELLSARHVQSFRGIREDEVGVGRLVSAMAAAAASREPVSVSERIAVLITDSAVRAMIGDRFKRREEFLQVLEEGVKLVAGFNLGDLFPSSWLASFVSGTARLAEENHRKSFELMKIPKMASGMGDHAREDREVISAPSSINGGFSTNPHGIGHNLSPSGRAYVSAPPPADLPSPPSPAYRSSPLSSTLLPPVSFLFPPPPPPPVKSRAAIFASRRLTLAIQPDGGGDAESSFATPRMSGWTSRGRSSSPDFFLDKGLLLLSSAITTRPLHNKMHTAVQQFKVQK